MGPASGTALGIWDSGWKRRRILLPEHKWRGTLSNARDLLTKFSIAQPALDLGFPPSEDCLFLDVYVPGSAVRNPAVANMPVLFWIYGGGYGEI